MRFPTRSGRCSAALLSVLFTFGALFTACATDPVIDKNDLFRAGDNGFPLYRIPGMVVTTKGSVLVYCEARTDARSDWGEIQVHLRRSADGGNSWEASRQVAHFGERIPGNPHKPVGGNREQTVNNPIAIVDVKTNAIHFLYCINYARCFYMKSDDDGVTFSSPVEITQAFEAFREKCDWKVLATGPGHGIQLRNGRLVVPVWLAYGKTGDHSPSMSGTIYSDDHGISWHSGEIALPCTRDWKNPNETAAVELSDGRVMLNARTNSAVNRRLISISPNGATHWSAPLFDFALFDPKCMGSLIRVPSENPRGRLLFCNPHNLKYDANGQEIPRGHAGRKNLSLQISDDDGQTWSLPKTVEEATSAYSDLAVLPDGTTLCFYERKTSLTIARLSPQWMNAPIPQAPKKEN
ncbi:MAG: sialidase-1 [Verrucomicrobia bacterium]|nr:MAG: sialidase-1 [Verrucomicrobiota bacterium]